jgi:hypothetical protein
MLQAFLLEALRQPLSGAHQEIEEHGDGQRREHHETEDQPGPLAGTKPRRLDRHGSDHDLDLLVQSAVRIHGRLGPAFRQAAVDELAFASREFEREKGTVELTALEKQ